MKERANERATLLGAGAALGLIGGALFLTRGAARDDAAIVYPPLDTPKSLGDDIWIVDSGPISALGFKLPVRMTVMRLRDGSLILHSPTRHTAALGAALDAIGTVRHIVAPTIAHWAYLEEWQRAYPSATCWAVPGLRDRRAVRDAGLRIDAELGEAAPADWADEIRQGLVRGGAGFEEAWFFHAASRTLVLTDLIENLDPGKLRPAAAAVMRATLATRGTCALHARAALLLNRGEAVAAISAAIATEPETVVFAHGDIFRGRGAARVRQAFDWLL
ncbi:DUF4336 domain-containing protein [Sphingomonas sp. NBWT7]|nr:DUF4336 domain-containing protein [Sphingomonas sp. NBWT7]QNE31582.1 DUF4336 domain-containing protein [Sphingomonas sp. NBWT7]